MTELIVQGGEDPAETAARREAWLAIVPDYAELRREAYASWGDQLDMQFHDLLDDTTTWRDHVASVKIRFPKP